MFVTALRKFILIATTLLLGYLLALSLFAYKAWSTVQSAVSFVSKVRQEPFTSDSRVRYIELLKTSQSIIEDFRGPLFAPLRPVLPTAVRGVKIEQVQKAYDRIESILPIVPGLAGFVEPRRYLLVFQNPAESRGTGGIIGAFAVAKLDAGELSIERVGSNAALLSLEEIPIPMPKDYVAIYGSDPAIWQNSNISPNFPDGAKIYLALWKNQFQEELDGVMTFDPIVLKHVLRALGPITVSGQVISADNVVAETLSTAYQRFETDNNARKQFLVSIIDATAKKLLAPNQDLVALAEELITPLMEHRILVYSTREVEAQTLERSSLSGTLSKDPSSEFRLVLINTAGNKMDYYLRRTLKLVRAECSNRKAEVIAQYSITSDVSESTDLPSYVKGRLDLDLVDVFKNSN